MLHAACTHTYAKQRQDKSLQPCQQLSEVVLLGERKAYCNMERGLKFGNEPVTEE